MNKKILIVLSLIFSSFVSSHSQKKIEINEVLTKALAQNIALKKQKTNAEIARLDAQKGDGVFLPKINLSYTATRTNDPLNVFGTKLKQKIVTQDDFNPKLLNDPFEIDNFNAKIKVEQPLFNLDGIHFRRAARAKANASNYEWERNKDYLIFQVKQTYAKLQLLYAANKVLKKAEETIIANKNLVKDMEIQGYAKPADRLSVEVRLTETQNKILNNKLNIQNVSDQLHYLMGESNDEVLEPLEFSTQINETDFTKLQLNENRADFLAYKEGITARKKLLHAYQAKFIPRVNAFGFYEFNDKKIFKNNADNYMVGIQLSWDIFNSNQNRKSIQKSRSELESTTLAYQDYLIKSKTDFSKAKRNIENAMASIELTKKAVNQSKESYRIRKNRFKEGLEKTTELLKNETQLEAKQLEYIQAIFQLKIATFYLDFLTAQQNK